MNEIDKLKMVRRNIEVEIKRHEDKIKLLQDERKAIDNRLTVLLNEGKGGGFNRISL